MLYSKFTNMELLRHLQTEPDKLKSPVVCELHKRLSVYVNQEKQDVFSGVLICPACDVPLTFSADAAGDLQLVVDVQT